MQINLVGAIRYKCTGCSEDFEMAFNSVIPEKAVGDQNKFFAQQKSNARN